MSIKQILILVLASAPLLLETVFAQAATPQNVKGVRALVSGSTVTVSFEPVSDAVFYRLYYSRKSILQNNGDYDDFERTTGSETSYTFEALPLSSPKMYVAVLAVNAAGTESEGFEVEASVDLPSSASSSSAPPSVTTSSVPGIVPPFTIISVESASSSGILVTFSKRLKDGLILGPEHFIVTDGSGTLLPLSRVLVGQTTLLIDSERQVAGRPYIFGILQSIAGNDGTSITPSAAQVQFFGYGEAEVRSSSSVSSSSSYAQNPDLNGGVVASSASSSSSSTIQDPASLNLTASIRTDGNYDVFAQWAPAPNAAGYKLYTSRDAAKYTWNSTVGEKDTSVQYRRISPGIFGVKVSTRDAAGNESKGIERAIDLPASGLGLFGIIIASGAGAARQVMRRRRVKGVRV